MRRVCLYCGGEETALGQETHERWCDGKTPFRDWVYEALTELEKRVKNYTKENK